MSRQLRSASGAIRNVVVNVIAKIFWTDTRTEATFDAAESADWDCNIFCNNFLLQHFLWQNISYFGKQDHPLLSTETTEYLNGYNFPRHSCEMYNKSFKPKGTPRKALDLIQTLQQFRESSLEVFNVQYKRRSGCKMYS